MNNTVDIKQIPSTGGIRICATAHFFPTDVAAPMLLPTTKILVAANELVNSLKHPLPLFTTYAISDHLTALKKLATVFETAASSWPVPNMKNLPQPESVQLVPIYVPQTPTQQFATHSTPVTPTPEPTANADIPAPITIPYNESKLSPPNPQMLKHHRPSAYRYPTQARNGPRHPIYCVLKENTLNICMVPEILESTIRPLWSLQHSSIHQPTTHCMYNVMNEETGEIQN